jgi:SH3 domain-containing protein
MARLNELMDLWCKAGPVTAPAPGKLAIEVDDVSVTMEVHSLSDDEAELRARWPAPAGFPGLDQIARTVTFNRTGLLRCAQRDGGLDIIMPLYLDGLSRHEFVSAAAEVGRAMLVIADSVTAFQSQREAMERAEKTLAELEARPAVADLVARQAAASAAAASTFVVAEGGTPAWSAPDPSGAPVATLAAGTELEVRERRGDWANVAASNGWSGWVDGRRLLAR